VFSETMPGSPRAYFDEVCRRELEGIVLKRLDNKYRPGERGTAWIKVKRRQTIYCAVIGFVPKGRADFEGLILAVELNGDLRCVGRVGTGFNEKTRDEINAWLWTHTRQTPVARCKMRGTWVEPRLFCRVSYQEITPNGELRAPVFEGLITQ
jgi:bifunctional non-homologous end joining protein LigD